MKSSRASLFSLFVLAVVGAGFSQGSVQASSCADEVLATLRGGNARYVNGSPSHPHQDAAWRLAVADGQHPSAVVITCADSRVVPEMLFDQGLGDIFVVRVAGNVANTDEIGSSENGIDHLEAPLLIVLGHTQCGAVSAVAEGGATHGNITGAIKNILPAVATAKATHPGLAFPKLVDTAVEANVWLTIDNLFEKSPSVRERVRNAQLEVQGAIYDLKTGRVTWLGAHPEQARLLTYTGGPDQESDSSTEASSHPALRPSMVPVTAAASPHGS